MVSTVAGGTSTIVRLPSVVVVVAVAFDFTDLGFASFVVLAAPRFVPAAGFATLFAVGLLLFFVVVFVLIVWSLVWRLEIVQRPHSYLVFGNLIQSIRSVSGLIRAGFLMVA
jgi:hypothetical protein